MHTQEMRRHFTKIYPKCSPIEIDNLVSAIISNKYWKVHSDRRDALYAVALTQAKIPFKDGYKVESTAPKPVIISPKTARFSRRGRILVIQDRGEDFLSETIMTWPIFLRLIRQDQDITYQHLIDNPSPPAFLNRRL